VETIIDKLLTNSEEYGTAKKFKVKTSSEPPRESALTRAYGPYELTPDYVLDLAYSLHYTGGDLKAKDVDDATIRHWRETLVEIAEGHAAFSQAAKPSRIELPNGAPLKFQYDKCEGDADAIGAVHISIGGPKYDIPLFAVRGNPIQAEDSFTFNLREVQAWIGDYIFMHHVKKDGKGNRDFSVWEDDGVPKRNIKRVNNVLLERRRAVDYLVRLANAGQDLADNKMKLKDEDIMLLLGMSYLQANNVAEIRGIRHEFHPDRENIEDANFNYNDYFAKWGQRTSPDPVHPWTLFKGKPSGFIPHIKKLPAGMRLLSISTYGNLCG
jgi:hypothetical protein